MSVDSNKVTVRRFLEQFVGKGHVDLADELLAPDFVVNHPATPGPMNRDALKQFIPAYHTAFPDLVVTLDELVGEGDTVAARFHFIGTHRGDFMGLAATGKAIEVTGMGFYHLKSGQIVEDLVSEDVLGMLRQLGALPMGSS